MPDTPPPRKRPSGCAVVLLAIPALLGGLLCGALAVTGGLDVAEVPDQGPWNAYKTVSLWWGVAAGVTTLLLAFVPSARTARSTVRRMAAADAGLVLAIFWPLQVAVLAGYAATRRPLPRTMRVLAVPAGAGALLAGILWGGPAYDTAQVLDDEDATAASLAGDWHTPSGGHLHLGADGRFEATRVPPALFADGFTGSPPGPTEAHGRWTYAYSPWSPGFTFLPEDAPSDAPSWLAAYRTGHTHMLCIATDPDTPCAPGTVFVR
ncbi:hypothetical protein [Streptomyces sp. NRRL F-5123]|uniref:hypothetical protein n=1 Tax=Streptomyces sp. NRRL F-5123 TaxID=1463856 RepID=UPI0004E22107|nr:hypothetical protein [Streptomyces sp. NRRL F-5123]